MLGGEDAAVFADARPSTRRMVWVVAVLGACFVSIRSGLADIPVLWFAALRALIGGVVLVGLGFGQHRRLPRGRSEWAVVTGLGLANATVGFAAMFLGVVHLATGIASVVANAQPLLIVLPAWALYGERPSRRTIVGLGVGLVGLVVVGVPGGGGSGAALSLGAAGAATAGTLIARRLGTLDDVVAGGWSFLLGGAMLAVWAGLAEGTPTIRWSLRFVGILAFLGVLGTAAVYVAWFKEARRCPLYRLTAWTFAVPLFGLVLAVVIEGEQPSVWTAVGLSVVITSMWLVLRGEPSPATTTSRGSAPTAMGDIPAPRASGGGAGTDGGMSP